MSSIKKLFKHSALYGIGDVVGSLLNFILLPLFTSYLSASDYGIIGILNIMSILLISLFSLGVPTGLFWYYYSCEDNREKENYISSAILFSVIAPLILMGIFILLSKPLTHLMLGDLSFVGVYIMTVVGVYLKNIHTIPLTLFRVRENLKAYLFASVLRIFMTICLKIYFVASLKMGVEGFFLSDVIVGAVMVLYFGILGARRASFIWEWSKIVQMVRYGAPLIPAALAFWVIESFDRWILQSHFGLTAVGNYTMAFSLTVGVTMLSNAFSSAWQPLYLSSYKTDKDYSLYNRAIVYYFLISCACVFGVSLFSRELIIILTHGNFLESIKVIPLIGYALVLKGAVSVVLIGLYITENTKVIVLIEIICSVVNIVLNLIITPRGGLIGAAMSLLITYTLMVLMITVVSTKSFGGKVDILKILKILFFTSWALPLQYIFLSNIGITIIIKSVCVLLVGVMVINSNILDAKDKRSIYSLFVRRGA